MQKISILSYSSGNGGISEYVNVLVERLKSEFNVQASVYHSPSSIPADGSTVLIEYAWNLATGEQLLSDVSSLSDKMRNAGMQPQEIFVEVHDRIKGNETKRIENFSTLIFRSDEIAKKNNATHYLVVPHISYLNVPKLKPYEGSEVKFGWFGFPSKKKRMVEIAKFATKLDIRANFVVSTSTEQPAATREICHAYLGHLQGYAKTHSNIVVEDVGFIPLSAIVEKMNDCSHIIFAHRNYDGFSGSMILAKRMNRPIISTDTTQARLAGIYTTSIISRRFAFVDALKVIGYHLLKERKMYSADFGEVLRALSGKPATLEEILRVRANTFYEGKKAVRTEDDCENDSLPRLVSILTLNPSRLDSVIPPKTHA